MPLRALATGASRTWWAATAASAAVTAPAVPACGPIAAATARPTMAWASQIASGSGTGCVGRAMRGRYGRPPTTTALRSAVGRIGFAGRLPEEVAVVVGRCWRRDAGLDHLGVRLGRHA